MCLKLLFFDVLPRLFKHIKSFLRVLATGRQHPYSAYTVWCADPHTACPVITPPLLTALERITLPLFEAQNSSLHHSICHIYTTAAPQYAHKMFPLKVGS